MPHSNTLRLRSAAFQLYELSQAYLSAAECLCELALEDEFGQSFAEGAVVLNLLHHAIELFYKGALTAKGKKYPPSHNLMQLRALFRQAAGTETTEFEIPFGYTDDSTAEIFPNEGKQYFQSLHQRFRYPTDSSGNIWPGVAAIDFPLLMDEMVRLRKALIGAWVSLTSNVVADSTKH